MFVSDDDGARRRLGLGRPVDPGRRATSRLSRGRHDRAGPRPPDWDLGATVRKMSDFNLTVAPVLDPEHRQILGVITVDDVLELLLPSGWRRDFGLTAAGGVTRSGDEDPRRAPR